MGEKLERVKAHLKNNWERYALAAVTIAGITYLIVNELTKADSSSEKLHLNGDTSCEKLHLNGDTVYSFVGDHNQVIVNEREGRGHPGYLIQHKETGILYNSQKEAAIALGIHQTKISDQINGRKDHADGHHFERLYVA